MEQKKRSVEIEPPEILRLRGKLLRETATWRLPLGGEVDGDVQHVSALRGSVVGAGDLVCVRVHMYVCRCGCGVCV